MTQNGYWIECIPVLAGKPISEKDNSNTSSDATAFTDLYSATVASIPEAKVFGHTPEKAIQALRDKLHSLRHTYSAEGRHLPEPDNPVRPPRGLRSNRGWISVYVRMTESCEISQD